MIYVRLNLFFHQLLIIINNESIINLLLFMYSHFFCIRSSRQRAKKKMTISFSHIFAKRAQRSKLQTSKKIKGAIKIQLGLSKYPRAPKKLGPSLRIYKHTIFQVIKNRKVYYYYNYRHFSNFNFYLVRLQ